MIYRKFNGEVVSLFLITGTINFIIIIGFDLSHCLILTAAFSPINMYEVTKPHNIML